MTGMLRPFLLVAWWVACVFAVAAVLTIATA